MVLTINTKWMIAVGLLLLDFRTRHREEIMEHAGSTENIIEVDARETEAEQATTVNGSSCTADGDAESDTKARLQSSSSSSSSSILRLHWNLSPPQAKILAGFPDSAGFGGKVLCCPTKCLD